MLKTHLNYNRKKITRGWKFVLVSILEGPHWKKKQKKKVKIVWINFHNPYFDPYFLYLIYFFCI